MLNVISIDVEEYFHAENIASVIGRRRWLSSPSRVEQSTKIVLELLARQNIRGTFFVLGRIARKHPSLVKDICACGHELASHGYSHRLAYQQSPKQFKHDVLRSKKLLEDLSGRAVYGYRAPNFSITGRNLWAYDLLIEAGYCYDSSRYPIWHPRYANQDKRLQPEVISGASGRIYVFPLAVSLLGILGKELRLPVAGGAYWRLFPNVLLKWGLRRIQKTSPGWFSCYVHPWEFDPAQPVATELSWLNKLRHYGGIKSFESKAEELLKEFSFGPFCEAGKQSFGSDFLDAAGK